MDSPATEHSINRNGENGERASRSRAPWYERLQHQSSKIRVAITGAGTIGKGLLHRCTTTPGFRCVVLADHNLEKAIACAESFEVSYRVVETRAEMAEAIDQGALAVCADGMLAARCERTDAFIGATGAIEAGGRFAETAIETGTHVGMMNAEADLTFGPYLMQKAEKAGVKYTSIDGDQHGVIRRLINKVELWGFDLVMAGNVKGYLDRYANPTSIIPEADKRDFDYRMCTSFTDGTKLCVEMALLANGLGLETAVPGMHGPRADHVTEAPDVFALEEMYAERGGVVDYVLEAEPGGGVFVVGYSEDPYVQDQMHTYKMGDGPFYVFYRPYHLCHVEALQSVAEAVLDGRPLLRPDRGFQTNVYAYAKRDLEAGETLDGIGGYCCYGMIENTNEQGDQPGVPICLIEGAELTRDVSRDEKIRASDVRIDPQRSDVQMYEKAREAASAETVPLA